MEHIINVSTPMVPLHLRASIKDEFLHTVRTRTTSRRKRKRINRYQEYSRYRSIIFAAPTHFAQRALLTLTRLKATHDALQAKAMAAGQRMHILEHAQAVWQGESGRATTKKKRQISHESISTCMSKRRDARRIAKCYLSRTRMPSQVRPSNSQRMHATVSSLFDVSTVPAAPKHLVYYSANRKGGRALVNSPLLEV